ncbi:MAG: ABC transporter substrate-binding protein [bacterium]
MIGLLFSFLIKKEELYIAYIYSHDESAIFYDHNHGKYQAINFYAERINKYGGVNGKRLVFLRYNDQGDPETAKNIAEEIVKENKVLAVVSQSDDSILEKTQSIYEKAEIPVLSAISQIKSDNHWLFQLRPSIDDYALYMANYTKSILKKNKVTIISSIDSPKIALTNAFATAFTQLGGEVINEFNISGVAAALKSRTHRVLDQLASDVKSDQQHLFLLTTPARLSAPFLVEFRRKGFNNTILSMNRDLANHFSIKDYPEEHHNLGYFTENVYVPSELLLDSISRPNLALVKKDYVLHHGHIISHDDMSSVLSAIYIIRALQQHESMRGNDRSSYINFEEKDEDKLSLGKMRLFLQEVFSERNPWFNQHYQGDISILNMGLFKEGELITAPINLRPVSQHDIDDFEMLFSKNQLIDVGHKVLYPTPLVYSGISMNRISDVKMSHKVTYYLDFYLWFRYADNVSEEENIEFLNAVVPTSLHRALDNHKDEAEDNKKDQDNNKESKEKDYTISAELIKSVDRYGEKYRRYHVRGYFETVQPKNYALGQQNAYVKFRHQQLNRYRLGFASDYINSNQGVFALEQDVINPDDIVDSSGLQLAYTFNYIGFSDKISLGSPESFYESNSFSKFTAEYRLAPSLWSFKGTLARINLLLSGHDEQVRLSLIILLLSIFVALFIFSIYAQHRRALAHVATLWWFLQLPLIYLILVLGNFALSQLLYNIVLSDWGNQHTDEIELIILYMQYSVSILWWLVPAYYLSSAISHFIWRPMTHQTGTDVPLVVRLFVQAIIYGSAILAIMSFVFNVTVTGLAATSGLLAIIFALSSKIDLSNIMAGLGISLSKIFKLGDWVKIGDVEGQVVEMTPRSTRILTSNASIINVPNVTVASEVIENYNQPTPVFRLSLVVALETNYTVSRIEKILLAAVAVTDEVLETPEPAVIFEGQSETGKQFQLVFFISNYAKQHYLWQATWRQVWQHLELAGVSMIMPPHDILESNTSQRSRLAKLAILKRIDALNYLSESALQDLADKLYSRYYQCDELILAADEHFIVLGIVVEGVVSYKKLIHQHWRDIDRIGAGSLFGATSLLDQPITEGAVVAKTDTIVLLLENVDFSILSAAVAEVEPTHSARYLSDEV